MAFARQIGKVRQEGEVSDRQIIENTYKNGIHAADMAVARKMAAAVLKAKNEGDSLGGIIECRIVGVGAGIGEPMFCSIEGELSQAVFAIPGVKGLEFGAGFASSAMRGSQHNDQYFLESGKVVTRTNNSGGILGGAVKRHADSVQGRNEAHIQHPHRAENRQPAEKNE